MLVFLNFIVCQSDLEQLKAYLSNSRPRLNCSTKWPWIFSDRQSKPVAINCIFCYVSWEVDACWISNHCFEPLCHLENKWYHWIIFKIRVIMCDIVTRHFDLLHDSFWQWLFYFNHFLTSAPLGNSPFFWTSYYSCSVTFALLILYWTLPVPWTLFLQLI